MYQIVIRSWNDKGVVIQDNLYVISKERSLDEASDEALSRFKVTMYSFDHNPVRVTVDIVL